jgi:hypothetical protein
MSTETSDITSYEWTRQYGLRTLRITNRTDERMLDDREGNGKIVSETERAIKILP